MSSKAEFHVLLVGNYEYDQQESMLRFAALLLDELPSLDIRTELIRPEPVFGRLRPSPTGLGKWLGYLDKFLVFPLRLRAKVRQMRRVSGDGNSLLLHICDHSNAFYCGVADVPTLVTCHDLLAVKGALGTDPNCPASRFGRILQRLILRGLGRADYVVCDSTATREDLLELSDSSRRERSSVVLLAQNHPYQTLPPEESAQRLQGVPALRWDKPYLLTVGSNLPRKNREGILRIAAQLGADFGGQIVFAGEALDAERRAQAAALGLSDRIVEITRPDNDVLEALYSRALALLYPSKAEGFGWPVIEAQACGCPVVCSDRTSVPEVAGEGAIVCALEDEAAFAAALNSLTDFAVRKKLVRKGFANLARFDTPQMLQRYQAVYRRLLKREAATLEACLVS